MMNYEDIIKGLICSCILEIQLQKHKKLEQNKTRTIYIYTKKSKNYD